MAKNKTTMRVLLSCTCIPHHTTARYGSTLDGLTRATRGWMDRGGHGNPNHMPTIRVEVLRFQRAATKEAILRRALSGQAERKTA
jgi:hypothetical protein